VTHDQREAIVLSQRLAVMRDGRFDQVGTPAEIYEQPANRSVAEFIGEINLIDGEVIASENGVQTIATEAGKAQVLAQSVPMGARVALALRPERLRLEKPNGGDAAMNHFLGTVTGRSYRGDSTLFDVTLACGLKMRVLRQNSGAGTDAVPVGATVAICFSEDAGILLKT